MWSGGAWLDLRELEMDREISVANPLREHVTLWV
jgi:hypothetical protein